MGFFLLALLGFGALCSEVRGDALEVCQPRNATYKIGDSLQCDKYHECTKNGKGETLQRLCPDGFMFSIEIANCDYPHNVNCTLRPALQPSQSTNPQCPRSNGFYEYPASESCQKFNHCLEGVAYEKTCPEGVIFDPSKGACIHPDLSRRPDCAAKEVLNFICPNSVQRFTKLKFGDHDRHAHPADCRKFLICLKNGKPRVGGCPLGKVFNPKSGYCDSPKNVPNCKEYYGKKDPEKLAKESESDNFNFGGGEESHPEESQREEETEENDVKSGKGKKVTKRHAIPEGVNAVQSNYEEGAQEVKSGSDGKKTRNQSINQSIQSDSDDDDDDDDDED